MMLSSPAGHRPPAGLLLCESNRPSLMGTGEASRGATPLRPDGLTHCDPHDKCRIARRITVAGRRWLVGGFRRSPCSSEVHSARPAGRGFHRPSLAAPRMRRLLVLFSAFGLYAFRRSIDAAGGRVNAPFSRGSVSLFGHELDIDPIRLYTGIKVLCFSKYYAFKSIPGDGSCPPRSA
jgi:hypothetical protein